MSDQFPFDVFLSHSPKDKARVRTIAERLRADGVRVWFDEWEILTGDKIPAKIEEGLERSRVLVLCMSAHAFGSDWAQLESGTFRFRDPLNSERRFVPLRLDDAPIRGALAQFLYIDWGVEDREQEYSRLLEACRLPSRLTAEGLAANRIAEKIIQLDSKALIHSFTFSSDGKRALSGAGDGTVRLWDVETGRCLRVLEGHSDEVLSLAWSSDLRRALSGSRDTTVRLWDVDTGRCSRVLEGHFARVDAIAWSADQRRALSGGADKSVRLWDMETGRCLRVFEGHTDGVWTLAWSADQRHALSGGADNTMRLWDVESGRCLRVLEGHTDDVWSLAWSADQRRIISGAYDQTVRVWELETARCVLVLEGHADTVRSLAWSPDENLALSGGEDGTVRLWDPVTGRCLRVLEGHTGGVRNVSWSVDGRRGFSADQNGGIRVWDISKFAAEPSATEDTGAPFLDQIQYTNAKVLLVGDSGSGKTGLSKRLALHEWGPSDSTIGAWATHWKLPVASGDDVEREIWLWDFGGQADQRLVHQLYMEDTALAVLVFDGQREDIFETLSQWDRDLMRASRKPFTKVLVAGRIDAGGLRVSRSQIEAFAKERGFACFLETSAKTDAGCPELRAAIPAGILWADIPWRSSPLLFKRLRDEIIRLKDEGRVLMRFNELRDALRLRLPGPRAQFTDDQLKAVIGLLAGPGVVWELAFGSWVLLQPEQINAYAQAVIRTLRSDEQERGAIAEERVLRGELSYPSSERRLGPEEERFVLLAMHQIIVERGLCLRVQTEEGPLLIFPSYYRRERPELAGHPAVLISYRFTGFLDDIYATLVVRLHHCKGFQQAQLWRYAADFQTISGKQLGIKLTRRTEGAGELQLYFDPAIPIHEKIIFTRYVHEHLLQKANEVVRLRHYVCPYCGTPVTNREVAMRRLNAWLERNATDEPLGGRFKAALEKNDTPTIICPDCENRVPLWDELEQQFASPETQQRVQELQDHATLALANESRERALVGEVISTVALAGQISREFNVSDHGIDMEIEFKSDFGDATGLKLFLQLKAGDSYDREPRGDGTEILTVREDSLVRSRKNQAFPVMLVVRNSDGEVRWMDIRGYFKRATVKTHHLLRQVAFEGERFDVTSVRRWRELLFLRSHEIANQRIEEAKQRNALELSLSGLRLTELPETLWQLTQLNNLDLSGNLLTSLSESLSRLTQLKSLNIARNQLNSLPMALLQLAAGPSSPNSPDLGTLPVGLEELFLHENKALGIPREILGPTWEEVHSARASREQPGPSTPAVIIDYYFSTRGPHGRPLREVKLIVVGRGGAGKTSLLRRLNGEPLNPLELETHGISIGTLSFACSDGPVKARVWDFGGQHILHAMHEFFLTARSLYLLVLGERDDMAERDAAYWLQLIRSYAGSVPVVVALNKSHGRSRDIDRGTLEQNYGPILNWIPTECDQRIEGADESIRDLRLAITAAAERMPEVRDLFPAAWWQIKNWLEEMPEPYLDFETFQKRCIEYGEQDLERQEKLSAWLHDLGIALNYARDPRLRSTTVLRPDWLANGIYGLLRANDPRLHARLAPDAILTTDRVGLVFGAAEHLGLLRRGDYPAEKWPFLLRLMTLFQLAYPLDEKAGKLLVPALLPLEPPAGSQEPVDSGIQRLRYEFSVIPGPLIPRLLVRMFSLIEDGHRWRRGAILKYAEARARIWATQDERWVYVTVSGPVEDRDALLVMIRDTLSDLFEDYKNLQVVEHLEFEGQWVPRKILEGHSVFLPTDSAGVLRE
jgi:small GTP-binding protein